MKKYIVKVQETSHTIWEIEAKDKADAENNYFYGDSIDSKVDYEEIIYIERIKK